jgi:hypothetical protein
MIGDHKRIVVINSNRRVKVCASASRFSAKADRIDGRLADFGNAGHFYNGGFSLSFGKGSGLLTICVDTNKSLVAFIEQSHLPMVMLPAVVGSKICGFPACFHSEIVSRLVRQFNCQPSHSLSFTSLVKAVAEIHDKQGRK